MIQENTLVHERTRDTKGLNDIIDKNCSLLVLCQTSHARQISKKEQELQNKLNLVAAFEKFEGKYGLNLQSIKTKIMRHGLYMTNGKDYIKHNSGLSFMQEFHVKKENALKLREFDKTFEKAGKINKPENSAKSWFWTITRKTFELSNPIIEIKEINKQGKHGENIDFIKLNIKFKEIEESEHNLRALMDRLRRYGYKIQKSLIVPECKDNKNKINLHYHIKLQATADLKKIRSNPNPVYRDLVYDIKLGFDRVDGYINNAVLSEIWKDITKGESYRIKPEEIRKEGGVFNYMLSYLNKPMQFKNYDMVPYIYFAMKSKKPYRISGNEKKLPKVECQLLDSKSRKIKFEWHNMRFISQDSIPLSKQTYYKVYYVDGVIKRKYKIIEYFKEIKQINGKNHTLHQYDLSLKKDRYKLKCK